MAQSVRERTSELAVLKTLGFSERVDPGARARRVAVHRAARRRPRPRRWPGCSCSSGDPTGGMLPIFVLPPRDVVLGVGADAGCMGLLAGVLPAVGRHAAEDHRRAEEELTCALAATDARRDGAQPPDDSRSGSARRPSPSSASPASSSCSCRCCRSPPGSRRAMQRLGLADRALVMRSGADSEMTSGLAGPRSTSSSRRRASGATARTPLASAELYVIIDLPKKSSTGHVGERADARRRAGGAAGARRSLDRRRPDVPVRHQRGHRRPRRQRAVRRA